MTETLSSFDVELGPTRCFRLFKPLGGVYDAEATVTWPTAEELALIIDIVSARWGIKE